MNESFKEIYQRIQRGLVPIGAQIVYNKQTKELGVSGWLQEPKSQEIVLCPISGNNIDYQKIKKLLKKKINEVSKNENLKSRKQEA